MSGRLFLWYEMHSRTIWAPDKAVQYYPIPGLYSGIFAMYLQYHQLKKDSTGHSKAKPILFYGLCALYILSLADISLDTTHFAMDISGAVSNNSGIQSNDCVFFHNSALISFAVGYHYIINIIHSSSDKRFLRLYLPDNSSMRNLLSLTIFLFIHIFKGVPLLDCVGAQYPDRDHSFSLRIHILRSVNLSSFTLKFQCIAPSYLDSERAPTCHCWTRRLESL